MQPLAFCAYVLVAPPLIVLVVGVTVAVPAPRSRTQNSRPASKPVVPACGNVTAIALPLLITTSLPISVESTVYVVPVWELTPPVQEPDKSHLRPRLGPRKYSTPGATICASAGWLRRKPRKMYV